MKTHPVASYFVLACALSWTGILLFIGGPGNLFVTPAEAASLIPRAIPIMLIGPGFAGLLMIGIARGRAGFRDLGARWATWGVEARWYYLAVFTAPVLATAALLVLRPILPALVPGVLETPEPAFLVIAAVVGSLLVGVVEELGWTGFALPELIRTHGVLATGVILGLLWGAWHGLLVLWGTSTADGVLVPTLMLPELVFYFLVLPIYRVLMVQVYDRTASMPVMVTMHTSLTAAVPLILMPVAASGTDLTAWYVVLALALVGVVAALRRPNGAD